MSPHKKRIAVELDGIRRKAALYGAAILRGDESAREHCLAEIVSMSRDMWLSAIYEARSEGTVDASVETPYDTLTLPMKSLRDKIP